MIKYELNTKLRNNQRYSVESYDDKLYDDSENIVENFEFNVLETEKENEKPDSFFHQPFSARINYHCLSKDTTSPYDDSTVRHLKQDLDNNEKVYCYESIVDNKLGNPNFLSKTSNQALAGPPNPKTMVAPLVAPRMADMEYWRMNDTSTPEMINDTKDKYQTESGYFINFNPDNVNYSKPKNYSCKYKKLNKEPTRHPNVSFSKDIDGKFDIIENFPYETRSGISQEPLLVDQERLLFNKPFNNNSLFKNVYNPNLFTQTVSSDTYHINDRNEPINSLMGVTYPQQFQKSNYEEIEPYEGINVSNVYDPRFNGYGTSYRSYIDDNLGQPRFYYDDVDSIKMPNYLTRNSIDTTAFGDSYGALQPHNPYTTNIHNLADQHYTDSMINFRTEMQERLMRKKTAENWQRRMYPISKNGQRMLK